MGLNQVFLDSADNQTMGELDLRKSDVEQEVGEDSSYTGSAEALKRNVLSAVANEQYDSAIHDLSRFLKAKSEYPRFRSRVERYIKHAIDLVNAIRTKKNFMGIGSLTRSKVQELGEKTKEHFDELQVALSKVAQIQNQLKVEDVRSTLWVVRALVHSAWIVLLVAFVLDVVGGLYSTTSVVLDDLFTKLIDWVFELF